MEYEDIRTYVRVLFSEAEGNKMARVQAEDKLKVVVEQNRIMGFEVRELTEQYESLTGKYGETSDKLREATEQNNELTLTLGEKERQITLMDGELVNLREKEDELRKLMDERFIM